MVNFYITKLVTISGVIFDMKCACCGGDMLRNNELENTIIYKCKECGLSNTELKANDGHNTFT
jgi:Zn finger protein HypA/HybF involved in hydrogenase expression